jgi:hypothetical protein
MNLFVALAMICGLNNGSQYLTNGCGISMTPKPIEGLEECQRILSDRIVSGIQLNMPEGSYIAYANCVPIGETF